MMAALVSVVNTASTLAVGTPLAQLVDVDQLAFAAPVHVVWAINVREPHSNVNAIADAKKIPRRSVRRGRALRQATVAAIDQLPSRRLFIGMFFSGRRQSVGQHRTQALATREVCGKTGTRPRSPTQPLPKDRTLQRVALLSRNRTDWLFNTNPGQFQVALTSRTE
jgi:hypothetical protein